MRVAEKSAQLRRAARADAIDGQPGLGVSGDQRLPVTFQVVACRRRYAQGFESLCKGPLPCAVEAIEHSCAAAITEAFNVSKLCRIQGQPIEKACD